MKDQIKKTIKTTIISILYCMFFVFMFKILKIDFEFMVIFLLSIVIYNTDKY